MPELLHDDDLRRVLVACKTIAVLGAHDEPERAACYVPDYLHAHGYRIIPVNPELVGRTLWGERVRATLAEIGEPVDMVDVFRNARWLPAHVPDILAMAPPPKVVWLQLGVRHDAFARRLVDAGIDVVQDRCTLADHERMGL
jgi:hypothetical protein